MQKIVPLELSNAHVLLLRKAFAESAARPRKFLLFPPGRIDVMHFEILAGAIAAALSQAVQYGQCYVLCKRADCGGDVKVGVLSITTLPGAHHDSRPVWLRIRHIDRLLGMFATWSLRLHETADVYFSMLSTTSLGRARSTTLIEQAPLAASTQATGSAAGVGTGVLISRSATTTRCKARYLHCNNSPRL